MGRRGSQEIDSSQNKGVFVHSAKFGIFGLCTATKREDPSEKTTSTPGSKATVSIDRTDLVADLLDSFQGEGLESQWHVGAFAGGHI